MTQTLFFFSLLLICSTNLTFVRAKDSSLEIKKHRQNKAISSKKKREYKDDKTEIYLKLSNIPFLLNEMFLKKDTSTCSPPPSQVIWQCAHYFEHCPQDFRFHDIFTQTKGLVGAILLFDGLLRDRHSIWF